MQMCIVFSFGGHAVSLLLTGCLVPFDPRLRLDWFFEDRNASMAYSSKKDKDLITMQLF